MKKILFLLILLLCGCSVKENINVAINEDKSLNLYIVAAFDNEFLNGAMNETNNTDDKEYSEEQMWEYLEELISSELERGYYDINKYDQNGYKGYTFSLKIDDIDEITGDDANFDIRNYPLIPEKKIFKKEDSKYISQMYYSSISGEKYVNFDFIFEITLPYPALSSNADNVSNNGKTLKWNTASTEEGRIDFEFSFEVNNEAEERNNSFLNIKTYIIIFSITAMILLIIILGIVIKKRRKEDF